MTPYEKLMSDLETMPLNEIAYIIGRYCGPNNYLLAMKTFGRPLDERHLHSLILERTILEGEVLE